MSDAIGPPPVRRAFPWGLAVVAGVLVMLAVCLVAYMVARAPRGAPESDPITAVTLVTGSLSCERWTDDSVRVVGRVQNTGTVTTRQIAVEMIVVDGSAEVARDTTYADQGALGRGEISGFTGYVTTAGASWDGCSARVAEVR